MKAYRGEENNQNPMLLDINHGNQDRVSRLQNMYALFYHTFG